MKRSARTILTASAVAALVFAGAAPTSADESVLVLDRHSITVTVPAPGHETEWSLAVSASIPEDLPLWIRVTSVDGGLFEGPDPVRVSMTDPSGTTVVAGRTVSELVGDPVPVGTVAPGSSRTLHGAISLPAAAGNEYQGVSGSMVLEVLAQRQDLSSREPSLASTGVRAVVILGVAGLCVAAGLAVVAARKRRSA